MPSGTSSQKPLLSQLSLAAFADSLAARTATPGGGSLAAYLVACGVGTVSMAFRFTSGDKYAAVESSMAQRAAELDRLRARALVLVDADSDSYDRVTAGFALPKTTDSQKAARAAAIQAALKGALEVPFETMQLAAAGLKLAAAGAAAINPNLASDCATGALALAAGLEGAWHNVRINAASIKDAEYVRAKVAAGETLRREASELGAVVRDAAAKHLG
jgi:formiminotetrahydrofolate cyclodeaminase